MRNAVGNFPNLPGFQAHFAATPQDAGANDQRQMTSETLYQFEWVSRSKATNIFKKIKDTWLAAEMANLSDKGTSTSDSPRVKMAKTISDLTDATTRFNAGSKGRVQSYNSALQQLANDNRINAGFLNTAPYICPSY
jgi:hypothetical protein